MFHGLDIWNAPGERSDKCSSARLSASQACSMERNVWRDDCLLERCAFGFSSFTCVFRGLNVWNIIDIVPRTSVGLVPLNSKAVVFWFYSCTRQTGLRNALYDLIHDARARRTRSSPRLHDGKHQNQSCLTSQTSSNGREQLSVFASSPPTTPILRGPFIRLKLERTRSAGL